MTTKSAIKIDDKDKLANNEIFHYEIMIKEHHVDMFGHVNNATYLQLLEEARWDIITQKGEGISSMHKKGIGPVILEVNIKYIAEIKLREKISISTQCISFNEKIATLLQEIKNSSGKLCSSAQLVVGIFDLHTRKLIEFPPIWKSIIGYRDS